MTIKLQCTEAKQWTTAAQTAINGRDRDNGLARQSSDWCRLTPLNKYHSLTMEIKDYAIQHVTHSLARAKSR